MRPVHCLLVPAALAAAAAPAAAQGGWVQIGEREVNDRVDRDVVAAQGGRRFTAVRVCVGRHAIRFHDLDVRFRNGGNQDVRVRSVIPAGGCTRDIALAGRGGRDITTVSFTYEAASLGRERSHVRVYAR
jgi:hypothetical protein